MLLSLVPSEPIAFCVYRLRLLYCIRILHAGSELLKRGTAVAGSRHPSGVYKLKG